MDHGIRQYVANEDHDQTPCVARELPHLLTTGGIGEAAITKTQYNKLAVENIVTSSETPRASTSVAED